MYIYAAYMPHICRIYAAKALFPNRKDEKTFVVYLRTVCIYSTVEPVLLHTVRQGTFDAV